MTSGKQARRQRQAAARPPVRSTEGRRASPKVLGIALAIVIAVALAVVLAVVLTKGSSGNSSVTGSTLPDSDVIAQQLGGIPQQGNVLGKASAPVTMVEYIDLQCPVCRQFETEVMPTLIQRYVRTGKVKVEARPIAFIGPDSLLGRRSTIAAGRQNRLYDFAQLLYANQGPENSGWLNDDMVTSAAKSIPGVDVQALLDESNSSEVETAAKTYESQANADGVRGTPALYVGKSGGTLAPVAADLGSLSAAINRALGQ
jgi:protein-disulfide isomerase